MLWSSLHVLTGTLAKPFSIPRTSTSGQRNPPYTGEEFNDTCCVVLLLKHEEDPKCGHDAGTKPLSMHHICVCTLLVVGTRQVSAHHMLLPLTLTSCNGWLVGHAGEKTAAKSASHAWSTDEVWNPHTQRTASAVSRVTFFKVSWQL